MIRIKGFNTLTIKYEPITNMVTVCQLDDNGDTGGSISFPKHLWQLLQAEINTEIEFMGTRQ
jgi:hypothetical protein